MRTDKNSTDIIKNKDGLKLAFIEMWEECIDMTESLLKKDPANKEAVQVLNDIKRSFLFLRNITSDFDRSSLNKAITSIHEEILSINNAANHACLLTDGQGFTKQYACYL